MIYFLMILETAFAFTLAGTSLENTRWPNKTVTFSIDDTCGDSTKLVSAVEQAVDLWNAVTTSALNLERVTSGADSLIKCETLEENIGGLGTPLGDLTINSTFVEAASETVVAVIVAHELGHVLGLGHTGDTTALMYFSASAKEVLALSQDDIDGITYLYPRDEIGGNVPFGCGTIQGPPGGPGPGGPIQMAFLFLSIYLLARIRLRFQSALACQA